MTYDMCNVSDCRLVVGHLMLLFWDYWLLSLCLCFRDFAYSMEGCTYPAAFLWGCSSGRLSRHGVYDQSGPALVYLMRGASWVVANIWDVTDKDIDWLSIHCISAALPDLVTVESDRMKLPCDPQTLNKPILCGRETAVSVVTEWQIGEERIYTADNVEDSPSCRFHGHVATALSKSRDICKLKYLVGASPVMYGIPTPLNV